MEAHLEAMTTVIKAVVLAARATLADVSPLHLPFHLLVLLDLDLVAQTRAACTTPGTSKELHLAAYLVRRLLLIPTEMAEMV